MKRLAVHIAVITLSAAACQGPHPSDNDKIIRMVKPSVFHSGSFKPPHPEQKPKVFTAFGDER
ncbi:MAG: hypothetical protein KDC70_16440, partial [Saprospiraceae bacterium]|nr:hypothetical protein [Saprospiraceae bacterium]